MLFQVYKGSSQDCLGKHGTKSSLFMPWKFLRYFLSINYISWEYIFFEVRILATFQAFLSENSIIPWFWKFSISWFHLRLKLCIFTEDPSGQLFTYFYPNKHRYKRFIRKIHHSSRGWPKVSQWGCRLSRKNVLIQLKYFLIKNYTHLWTIQGKNWRNFQANRSRRKKVTPETLKKSTTLGHFWPSL